MEDDQAIAKAVAAVLTKQHYVVDIAADGQAGWEFAVAYDYNLILLDVMLPKLDGISLCRQLRQKGYQMPILMLTARDNKTDKVIGLDAGADDYVVKPFDFQELIARIRALLRRESSTLPPVLEYGSLRLDPSTCEITYGSQFLHLTPKEYGLLELFLRNKQRVFSRSAIIDHLWTLDDPPEEDTIKSHIKGLRQKLKAAGAPTDLIETVYGLGYRLKPLSHEEKCQIQASEPESSWVEQQTMLAVAKAREDFKAGISDRLAVLEQTSKALKENKLGEQLRSTAEQEAHKLAGSLGSFGFAEGSRLAQEIEQMLQHKNFLDRVQSLRLRELVMELHREIEQTQAEPTWTEPVSSEQRCQLLQRFRANEFKVMVVDDEPAILTIIQNLLEPWGIRLVTLEDPRRFWQVITEFSPDLLILDVKMPHVDGIELCQALRNDSRWSELPVLFLTAYVEADTVDRIFATGADDCVSKPIVGAKLITRIFNRLERIQLLQRIAEIDALTRSC